MNATNKTTADKVPYYWAFSTGNSIRLISNDGSNGEPLENWIDLVLCLAWRGIKIQNPESFHINPNKAAGCWKKHLIDMARLKEMSHATSVSDCKFYSQELHSLLANS